MPRIEIILPDDARIELKKTKLRGSPSEFELASWEGERQISDSMRHTPNICDDVDAKSDTLEDDERQLATKLSTAAAAPDPTLDLAGVIWRPADSIRKLIGQINKMAPNRNKASDGVIGDENHKSHDSDHNPWIRDGGFWVVSAVDVTNDPEHGCSAQSIVNALVKSKDARIKYIIWKNRIISSTVRPWIWRRYPGKNPHNKHLHLSVVANKTEYDSTVDWQIT